MILNNFIKNYRAQDEIKGETGAVEDAVVIAEGHFDKEVITTGEFTANEK